MKCASCGLKARCSPDDDSQLIFVHGPADDQGLRHFYLYCRQCKQVSDFVPTLNPLRWVTSGPFKAVAVIDPRSVYAECERAQRFEWFGIFAGRIQDAMVKVRVIPQRRVAA